MSERLDLLTGKWIKNKAKRKAPEAAVGRAVDDFLKLKGAYMRTIKSDGTKLDNGKWRTSSQGRGISDRIGIMPDGRFIAVELKATGLKRTVTEAQLHFLMCICKKGGIACVADCVEDVETALTQSIIAMMTTLQSLEKKPEKCSNEPLFP